MKIKLAFKNSNGTWQGSLLTRIGMDLKLLNIHYHESVIRGVNIETFHDTFSKNERQLVLEEI